MQTKLLMLQHTPEFLNQWVERVRITQLENLQFDVIFQPAQLAVHSSRVVHISQTKQPRTTSIYAYQMFCTYHPYRPFPRNCSTPSPPPSSEPQEGFPLFAFFFK